MVKTPGSALRTMAVQMHRFCMGKMGTQVTRQSLQVKEQMSTLDAAIALNPIVQKNFSMALGNILFSYFMFYKVFNKNYY